MRDERIYKNVVNLTPHDVVIFDSEGKNEVFRFRSCGSVRVAEKTVPMFSMFKENKKEFMPNPKEPISINVVGTMFGNLVPDNEASMWFENGKLIGETKSWNTVIDNLFIVSPLLLDHDDIKFRGDIACPDTGPSSVVRDEAGRIVGVKRLRRIAPKKLV